MRRKPPTLSGLTREPDAKSSQQPSLRLRVQNGVHACNNTGNVVLSKESQLLRSGAGDFSNLNHGSRENRISGQSEKKQTSILLSRWTCPPKFILNMNWYVAAGEESEEVKVQEQREARSNHSIYPHPSAIPPSPSVSSNLEEDHLHDDETTPIIPLEPDASEPCTGLDADVGAAASAAFTALMKSYEQGNLIDTELLIKLLNDPKMIELLKNIGPFSNSDPTQSSLNTPSCVATNPVKENLVDTELLIKLLNDPKMIERLNNTGPLANSDSTQPSSSCLQDHPLHPTRPNVTRESFPAPRPPASSTTIFARPPSTFPQKPVSTDSVSVSADKSSSLVKAPPPVKDLSYLKSLVRQHGIERPEVEGPRSKPKTSSSSSPSSYSLSIGESRNQLRHPKGHGNKRPMASSKPCMYFGSPKGCRLGPSCPFRHELPHHQPNSGGVSRASGSKRIKL